MGFAACHPAVNLIYFVCEIASTLYVRHPVYLLISFLCALAYTVKLNGKRGAIFAAGAAFCACLFALWYSSYHHFGVTVLWRNFIGNNITLESFLYGLALGAAVASTAVWFSCVHAVFTADKVVYLFGKVSPRLSLFLAILLRMVPRIRQQAKKLNTAQSGMGMAVGQGNIWQRGKHALRIFSMLITWSIDMLTDLSESMQSRGSTLKGRTAFSIYRFDNRDRAYVVALFAAITVLIMGLILGQGYISYSPTVQMAQVTVVSLMFYIGYAVLCMMPLTLDLWTEYRFERARRFL